MMEEAMQLDPTTEQNLRHWLDGDYDEETKEEIRALLRDSPQVIVDAFYTHLTFGTGGLRGVMGVGTNRMNRYTIRAATQGLANYLNQVFKKEKSVFIGYDSRINSRLFAEEAAKVLAGNGIGVCLCKELRPTPYVSFGCRHKKCQAAIMITASHNPPEYNGYKVYWDDGGQIVPPHDEAIVKEVRSITDEAHVRSTETLAHPLIEEVLEEMDEAYLAAIAPLQFYPDLNKKRGKELHVVYTSLHGAGITLMPEALSLWGFPTVSYVEEQIVPDGTFPTTRAPNPEEAEALQLGIKKLEDLNGDLLIANDPDADRVGVVAMHDGEPNFLTGNQIACLCLEHICQALSEQEKMPTQAGFIKTIGTTELFQAICDHYKVTCVNTLTGFKYIAEKIREWEATPSGKTYIFGGEESYGYLLGTEARDKDAIVSAALICEVALQGKIQGKTLVDKLYKLYEKYGVYSEKLRALQFPETKEGKEKMAAGVERLQKDPPQAFNGIAVETLEDYQTGIRTDLKTGKSVPLTLPKSSVLLFWLADGTKIMVRPSGTEPKIKLYCGIVQKEFDSVVEARKAADKKGEALLSWIAETLF